MINKIIQLIREMKYEEIYLLIRSFSLEKKWEIISTDLYCEDPKCSLYVFIIFNSSG